MIKSIYKFFIKVIKLNFESHLRNNLKLIFQNYNFFFLIIILK